MNSPDEDKHDDTKNSVGEKLERVLDEFPNYHIEILLGDFSVEVRRDVFKSTTWNKKNL
jgi:hypothetical protein